MTKRKRILFDKIVKKDYNNELEEVLAKKNFQEEVKNLLLDILYKIDNSYKDYKTVKKNVSTQEIYIKNIIKAVKNDCESIKLVKPDRNHKKTFEVNKEKKIIECYPIERKLLYCLAKIQKCDDIIREEPHILNRTLTNLINTGNNINTVEPLRDFNGFSWNIATLDIENFYYNIVYQDLIILGGNDLLEEWTNIHSDMVDYYVILKDILEKTYGKKFLTEIMDLLKTISILLELSINQDFKEQVIKRKKYTEEELAKMENKLSYLEELSKRKKKLTDEIRNLDLIINDKEKLQKEYIDRNNKLPLEQKIFSKRVLKNKLNEERQNKISELKECNEKMKSKNYLRSIKEYKYELKYLEIVDTEDLDKELLNKIILLQKRVLQSFRLRISRANSKGKLMKIFYEIRYFSLIPVDSNKNISQIPRLKKSLDIVKKEAIEKAYELKVINQVSSKNLELNEEIIKLIFSLDIIKLEDIYAKIQIQKDGIYVQFYDENIDDEKIKLKYDWKKEGLKIKLNKKVKIFI